MKHARACLAIAAALTLAAPFAASAQENESPYSWNVTAGFRLPVPWCVADR